ncbi:hypothetical protein L4C54_22840 [Vibrio lamellibrachiae]|uniref:hypothetical protein n=1 Tax=Vibrio lamellibrachiae TaxID=2910253 RepID=UPI003D13A0A1
MKQFFLIFVISSTPPLLIYWVGINAFSNYTGHLGYFGLFPVFSTHVLIWGLLGGSGFAISSVLAKHSLKYQRLPFKNLAILGLLIGTSHIITQLNIEYFLTMLPLSLFISWVFSSFLYQFCGKAG